MRASAVVGARVRRAIISIFGVALFALSASAQMHELSSTQTLGGMRRVYVLVTADSAAVNAGLDTTALRAKVELAVRRLGIVVMSRDEYMAETDPAASIYSGRLDLQVGAIRRSADYLVAGTMRLAVRQYVWMGRDRNGLANAETWAQDRVGILSSATYVDRTTSAVDVLLDEFGNDYLAANPVRQ